MQGLTGRQVGRTGQQYKQLLEALNDVAHRQVDAWLAAVPNLTEPFVARSISQMLPAGGSRQWPILHCLWTLL